MNKKILAIASDDLGKASHYRKQIEFLFHDKVLIKELHITENTHPSELDLEFDVALICAERVFYTLKLLVGDNIPLIMFKRTISKTAFNLIREIPSGSNVAVYGSDYEMEFVIITRLYTLGLTSINFHPYRKIKNNKEKIDCIIILDDEENKHKVKIKHKHLIFAGHSLLDVSTIGDLATKLDLEDYIFNKDIITSFEELASVDFGFLNTLKKAKLCESHLSVLLDIVNKGVIGIDSLGFIKTFNNEAKDLLQFDTMTVSSDNVFQLYPFIPFKKVLSNKETIEGLIITYQDIHLIISIAPMFHSGKITGAIATLKKYTDAEKEQHKIRTTIMNKGHKAKYNFNDIISVSKEMEICKNIARTMANSESSILVTGETGTGKELFVQSIHNCSPRKDEPFVALNCGALSENLMESELFGYVDGAFTGAKKGGKQGLFELAHKGTIFLDEIAEIPPYLQLKLLRVIQEREVMKIGSNDIIKIDIRIIAATNQDLKKAVANKRFRDDLYYRLNVLPLNIPSLRTRRDDIIPLFNYFYRSFGAKFSLTREAEETIKNHNWKGNVRELENVVEYLSCLNFDLVETKDLPIESIIVESKIIPEDEKSLINSLLITIPGEIDNYIFILSELEKSSEDNIGIGRRILHQRSIEKGLYLSEHEIRKILKRLESFAMIDVSQGRGGSNINQFGIDTLSYLNFLKK